MTVLVYTIFPQLERPNIDTVPQIYFGFVWCNNTFSKLKHQVSK